MRTPCETLDSRASRALVLDDTLDPRHPYDALDHVRFVFY